MIKQLKLQKAVYVIILGIVALIVAEIMSTKEITGASYVLGLSGLLMIIGACMFIYPILFAKKDEEDGNTVSLKPMDPDADVTEKQA